MRGLNFGAADIARQAPDRRFQRQGAMPDRTGQPERRSSARANACAATMFTRPAGAMVARPVLRGKTRLGKDCLA